ncbi:TlyA family RNA methyltransferase [Cellulomonas sp. KRMCY2]|uniref:TlyA family RNA methyltransferase n=1 Tax=Cellulomonas sp. KRMCY2 TaxID=1304865 RepID=UPI00045E938E|nr:TlyA family RNA methyltransferase [Cellulomonas sp. KRMCY2]
MAAERLDAELVRRGLARSRRRATELVSQGRVSVGGAVARKPSQPVLADDVVQVEPEAGPEYVSRAAHKLSGALDALAALAPGALTVSGARCLDAGASTGGFTQVLLERGAAHVLAVDVGHGQIADVVAKDARVTVHEGTNVRTLTPADVGELPALVVGDLSFISLTLVVPVLLGLTADGGNLLLLVKPQFELGRDRLGASGVVSSPALRQECVLAVAAAAVDAGALVRAVVPSPLSGPSGNHEFFLWLTRGQQGVAAPDRQAPAAASHSHPATSAPARAASARGPALVAAVRCAVVDGRASLVGPEGPAETGGPEWTSAGWTV